jgi:hypothetical protein
LWLVDAPNMEILHWEDPHQIYAAKSFLDNYVTTWNPREHHDTHMAMHQSIEDEPCLLHTKEIFATNPLEDYEQLLIEFKDIQSAMRKHVSVEEKLHSNAGINSLGRYKWSHHSTLMKWVKRHIGQHAMMSASISIILTYSKHGEKM